MTHADPHPGIEEVAIAKATLQLDPAINEGGMGILPVDRQREGGAARFGRCSTAGGDMGQAEFRPDNPAIRGKRSEEHTSELQSLMRISYAVFCLKKKKHN